TEPTEPYTLSLHDALPISTSSVREELSLCRLAIAGGSNLHVGVGPDLLELGIDFLGLFVFVLRIEAAGQAEERPAVVGLASQILDRKSTRLNSSHVSISYA